MPASIPDIEDLGPSNWRLSYSLIKMMRAPGGPAGEAPVDFMGCSSLADPSAEPKVQRFQTLVSLLLSSKTRDEMTAAAVRALQAMPGGLNAHTVAGMTEEELAPYIKTVGFSKYVSSTAP
jgi:endonuclease-3